VWERLYLKSWPWPASDGRSGCVPEDGEALYLWAGQGKARSFAARWRLCRMSAAVKEMIDAKMVDRGTSGRNDKLGIAGFARSSSRADGAGDRRARKWRGLFRSPARRRADRFVHTFPEQRDDLTAAYVFLRDVEHKLQMVQDFRPTPLPDSAEELERCAIRGGYDTDDRAKGVARFRADTSATPASSIDSSVLLLRNAKTSPVLKATMRLVYILQIVRYLKARRPRRITAGAFA